MKRELTSCIILFGAIILLWFLLPTIYISGNAIFANYIIRFFVLFIIFIFGVIKIFSFTKVKSFLRINNIKNSIIAFLSKEKQERNFHKNIHKQSTLIFNKLKLIFKHDRKRKKYFNSVPWYLIIGDHDYGKKTLIENAGFNFSPKESLLLSQLQAQLNSLHGCNWWFSREAVFASVDNSNSDLPTCASWDAILKIFRKYRKRKFLNGVIVTINLTDLLQKDVLDLQSQSVLIKEKIQQAYSTFNIRVPVYIVFTKCDLLGGFTEFFNDFNLEERAQPWGVTLPLEFSAAAGEISEYISHKYDDMVTCLQEKVLWRLSSEHDPTRRELISYFPQQFQICKNLIIDFIVKTFANGDYDIDHTQHLRGIYFSSAAQNSQPKDILMEEIGKNLNLSSLSLPEQLPTTHSFFLRGLFAK